jgi:hypothetical protein
MTGGNNSIRRKPADEKSKKLESVPRVRPTALKIEPKEKGMIIMQLKRISNQHFVKLKVQG